MKIFVLIMALMALYLLSGTSDQLDTLTADQRAEVVSRWQK